MARILIILIAIVLGLCVVGAGVGYFWFIPRAQDEIEAQLEEAVSTYVVPYFAGLDVTPGAGTYTLSADDVNAEIQGASTSLEDLRVEITPEYLALTFGDQNQDVSYTAKVEAVEGQFAITDATIDGVPGWLLPEDTVTAAIEDALNAYLSENSLILTDVTLDTGTMTITTANA